ncbi:chemotaxis protein CheW [Hydrogenophaga pseudoflava]|uniref:chemotaxis protein CheW n=1 Tax=Hydrogenophaga pseudoflava TaxID=47421 RepID=UPI0027E3D396|nr:chemotaxis protein CheW [Hydrogenophaga pseudoflava]MDQ7746101.1 chemotaxis protein CheW [Hydrogenophaga pseudoflava]
MTASTPTAAGDSAAGQQFLTFLLGKEVFAMDIRTVREIIQYGPLTSVPLMPDFVRGVINLRGAVVPVIDLHARFGRPVAEIGKKTCIVIFDAVRDGERTELGLLVDAVSEVVDIPAGQIEPPPSFGTAVRRDFIQGMGKLGERFVIILAPDKAFDVDDMARLCEATQESAAA